MTEFHAVSALFAYRKIKHYELANIIRKLNTFTKENEYNPSRIKLKQQLLLVQNTISECDNLLKDCAQLDSKRDEKIKNFLKGYNSIEETCRHEQVQTEVRT